MKNSHWNNLGVKDWKKDSLEQEYVVLHTKKKCL